MKGGLLEVTKTLDLGTFWIFGQGARPLARLPPGATRYIREPQHIFFPTRPTPMILDLAK